MAANLLQIGRRTLRASILIARYYFFAPVPVLEREVLALAARNSIKSLS